ncbi:MAG: hypothetical protein OXG37_10090 [Actinomycetia bacterium]|nr:hypothetical protein [Actinomycetes bacterium]
MPDQPQLPLGQADPGAVPGRRSGGCAGRGGSALARGAPDLRGRDGGGSDGTRTADLGGHSSTTELTGEVIARARSKLDIWASLGDI